MPWRCRKTFLLGEGVYNKAVVKDPHLGMEPHLLHGRDCNKLLIWSLASLYLVPSAIRDNILQVTKQLTLPCKKGYWRCKCQKE